MLGGQKKQNLPNSCSNFLVQGSQSGPARSPQFTNIMKMATANLKRSYPNLLILYTPCRLKCLKNHTEQSYMSIKSDARMSYSFSSYFFSNKYSKFWSGTLAQVWTSYLQLHYACHIRILVVPKMLASEHTCHRGCVMRVALYLYTGSAYRIHVWQVCSVVSWRQLCSQVVFWKQQSKMYTQDKSDLDLSFLEH